MNGQPSSSAQDSRKPADARRMMTLRSLTRDVRQYGLKAAVSRQKTVENDGVTLSLEGMSRRMRLVLLSGEYEREDTRLARRHLTAKSCVLELGASIGFVSLFCRKVLGVRDYALVEANPALIDQIHTNYALNSMTAPTIINAAAAGEDGRAQFQVRENFWASSLIPRANDLHTVEVEQLTIPSLIGRFDFTPDTLIMDIEGGEMFIPADHLARFDTIITELHPELIGEARVRELTEDLAHRGLREVEVDHRTHVFRRAV